MTEIARATGGALHGPSDGMVTAVSTDSRSCVAGQLFVPLKGDKFDGHDFVAGAAERGVRHFLMAGDRFSQLGGPSGASVVVVDDTLRALGDLAAYHRRRFELPIIGVTGSNGKTTTKEMLSSILAFMGPGLKTSGNLNNLIGLPQMLFQLEGSHRWGVLEMGMSEFGEIDRLAEIARPSVGIITNAFPAHLATMGSVDGVAKAKGELFLRLPAGGCAIYNADDARIAALPVADGVKRVSFGLHEADVKARAIENCGIEGQKFVLQLPGTEVLVKLRAFGKHNIYNALAAAATAIVLGVKPQLISEGLEYFTPYDKRFKLEEVGGVVLIDDSYNANPSSLEAALLTVKDLKRDNRAIAILGDMLELGEGTERAHRNIGTLAATCVERLYVLGELSHNLAEGAIAAGMRQDQVIISANHQEIVEDLQKSLTQGDFVLVKGSRGMRMERVAEGIRAAKPSAARKG